MRGRDERARGLWHAAVGVWIATLPADARAQAPVQPDPPRVIDTRSGEADEPLPSDRIDASEAAAEPSDAAGPTLGVTARIARTEPHVARFEREEARDLPGALGDPFRAALILPGVVPLLDGLPFFHLRGAPPIGTAYVYDGIVVPALFHLAAGPAVIHPQMVGAIEVHPGVSPARYGGHTGGVVVGEAAPRRAEDVFAEAELRSLDVNGFVHARAGPLTVSAAARIGYPGLLVSALSPDVDLAYVDYQARARYELGGGLRLELVGLGAYDALDAWATTVFGERQRGAARLLFHRLELRTVLERPRTEVGLGLRVGQDESELVGDALGVDVALGVTLVTFGTRFWIQHREGDLQLRFGGDLVGGRGAFFEPDARDRDGLCDPALPAPLCTASSWIAALRSARQRLTANLHAELEWRPVRQLMLSGGVRAELWVAPGRFEAAVDPRLRATWTPLPEVSLHLGLGVARQPAVFMLPLPGLTELPIADGLQTAIQSELGARVRARFDVVRLTLGATLFVHHYDGLLLPDILGSVAPFQCDRQGLCRVVRDLRTDALAYGGELSAEGALGPHLAARVAYTLSRVESDPYAGEAPYTPSYDVTHVLNLVLAYDSRDGFTAGVRAFVRSGAVQGVTYVDPALSIARYQQELPAFVRLDASVAYAWNAGWADLRLTLEWLNTTFALGGEPRSLECGLERPPSAPCAVTRMPPIFAPNLGLRGTFR